MSELHQCERCKLRLVEIDAYGEHLRGCLGCNRWQVLVTGEWRQLPEDDIAALRGMGTNAPAPPKTRKPGFSSLDCRLLFWKQSPVAAFDPSM